MLFAVMARVEASLELEADPLAQLCRKRTLLFPVTPRWHLGVIHPLEFVLELSGVHGWPSPPQEDQVQAWQVGASLFLGCPGVRVTPMQTSQRPLPVADHLQLGLPPFISLQSPGQSLVACR